MSIFRWLKDKFFWILGGFGLVLGAIFAASYEKKKIRSVKAEIDAEKAKYAMGELEHRKKEDLKSTARYEAVDREFLEEIERKDKEIETARVEAKRKNAEELARRLNELYKKQRRKKGSR